jgi:hypothetical protein
MTMSKSAREKLFEVLRAAIEYHQLGYRADSEFDANTMLDLMDQLTAALVEFDAESERQHGKGTSTVPRRGPASH